MTHHQKLAVQTLRAQGKTISAIAAEFGLSINTVKSFCRRGDIQRSVCKNCGKPLAHTPKHKRKIFCNDRCRQAWWRANPGQMQKKAFYRFTCEHCRQPFDSYGNAKRRFCSRDCCIAHRYQHH